MDFSRIVLGWKDDSSRYDVDMRDLHRDTLTGEDGHDGMEGIMRS